METYLMITQINDFIFCPRSLYFHNFLQNNFAPDNFREKPQIQGLAAHASIDQGNYSSCLHILQGTTVYSSKYHLLGRIDLFNTRTGCLTERKYSITAVYDGFRYQLYAQFFALSEMGYQVRNMILYSSKDNKKYPISMPDRKQIADFEQTLDSIRNYSPEQDHSIPSLNKCRNCNYREICSWYPAEERS